MQCKLTTVEAVASRVPSWFIARQAILFSCAWTLNRDFYSILSPLPLLSACDAEVTLFSS